MGLIKAALGSAFGTFADQWLEFIYCDTLSSDVLMQKGNARVGGRSGNTGRDSNIISDGSKIVVNEGQCMLVVENGKIIDYSSEPGGYIYNTGTEPSLFDDSDYSLKSSFHTIGQRFKSGGQAMNDQRVYFVNKKEILDNKIGVGNVPFRDGEFNMTLMLRGAGTYSFRIKDPIVFYTNVCANVPDSYPKSNLDKQLRAEMQSALIPLLGRLGEKKIRYDQIPLMTDELVQELNAMLNDKWREKRGIELDSLVLQNILPDEASINKIRELQESSIYAGQTQLLGARIGAAQASAIGDAANNASGAMAGFMGMNMAMGGGGVNANELLNPGRGQYAVPPQYGAAPYAYPSQYAAPAAEPVRMEPVSGQSAEPELWTCECGAENKMIYCSECGKKRPPAPKMWKCECGQENKGKFCGRCGSPRPKRYVCDKCGYELDPSSKPPKFCPQCGDPIDEKDEVND